MIQEKNIECYDTMYYIIITKALKEQFTQNVKFCDYLLTPSQMESHLKFYSPQIIPGASQQNSIDAFLFEVGARARVEIC